MAEEDDIAEALLEHSMRCDAAGCVKVIPVEIGRMSERGRTVWETELNEGEVMLVGWCCSEECAERMVADHPEQRFVRPPESPPT